MINESPGNSVLMSMDGRTGEGVDMFCLGDVRSEQLGILKYHHDSTKAVIHVVDVKVCSNEKWLLDESLTEKVPRTVCENRSITIAAFIITHLFILDVW